MHLCRMSAKKVPLITCWNHGHPQMIEQAHIGPKQRVTSHSELRRFGHWRAPNKVMLLLISRHLLVLERLFQMREMGACLLEELHASSPRTETRQAKSTNDDDHGLDVVVRHSYIH